MSEVLTWFVLDFHAWSTTCQARRRTRTAGPRLTIKARDHVRQEHRTLLGQAVRRWDAKRHAYGRIGPVGSNHLRIKENLLMGRIRPVVSDWSVG